MKKRKPFQINNKLEIIPLDDECTYVSSIQEVNEDTFSMTIPEVKRIQLRLKPQDKVNVTIFTENALYKFVGEVKGLKVEDDLEMYVLHKPTKMQKIERRNFVRIDISLDVEYETIDASEKGKWEKIVPTKKAYTSDLSGGGMQLILDKSLPEGTLIVLKVPLIIDDSEVQIKVLGRVMRSELDISNQSNRKYHIGLKLEDITERQRDYIIKFIFSQMRKKMHLLME